MPENGKTTLLALVYTHVELALWASLVAALALFAVFVAPGIPAAQQRSEAERAAAFERECDFYCTRWGLHVGTRRYSQCVSDLHRFRETLEKELVEAESF